MQAALYSDYGAPSVISVGPTDRPGLAERQTLIRVAGAGLNPVDAKLRSGALASVFPLDFPVIPGWDVSGTVDAVASDVDPDWIGKRVFAYTRYDSVGRNGTCADYCAVPASFLAEVPPSLDLALAAAVPLVALTAYQSVVENAQVSAGQRALVLAGGGAVGHYAIQMAKAAGAAVTTTASPGDHDKLHAKGAQTCINYRDADWAQQAKSAAPEGFDIILDGVGGESLAQCYDLLAPGGCLVGLNDPPDPDHLPAGAKGVRLFSRPEASQLAAIAAQLKAGTLIPDETITMPLGQVAEAHELLDKGHKSKIVLVPAGHSA